MAGWITLFKAVPWMELIAAAPVVARGAKKLWTGIRTQRGEGAPGMPATREERLEALEAQVMELKQELDSCSELIKAMTEQQARLVEAVGILRARTRALLVVSLILVVLSIVLAFQVWG
jgi:hypothetical protein